jgi:hypothetical protein
MSVKFFFDPACPWTWVTSRWLVAMAEREGFDVEWRSFSLPYQKRADIDASTAAHRVIESLRALGDNEGVRRFYDELGRRWHENGDDRTVDSVREAAGVIGATVGAVDDPALDVGVATSTEGALAIAGPDIGSPVVQLEDGRSMFGPILHAVPDDRGSKRVWDALQLLADVPEYHELKRGRRRRPETKAS